jgi:hypothetical protein
MEESVDMKPTFFSQIGGARNQSKPLMTYVGDKIQNVMKFDNKTLFEFLEHTEYLIVTIIFTYFYARFLDNLFPIQKKFSVEKMSLDLALHVITLSVGFFLLPKIIQIVPGVMHGSTSFSSYQTDAYKGAFVCVFLGLFSYSSLRKKIGNLVRGNVPITLFQESENFRNLDENPVIDEKTRKPKSQVKAQNLPTPSQKYPTVSPVPTVDSMDNQKMAATEKGGFGRPVNTRVPSVDDGTDIRNFLQQTQDTPQNNLEEMNHGNNIPQNSLDDRNALAPPQHEYGSLDSVAMFAESAGMAYPSNFAPF